MQKKGQSGFLGIFATIGTISIIAIVILLIYSNVNSATDSLYAKDTSHVMNESLGTISITDANQNTNSTLITQLGYVTNSERVYNNSGSGILLKRNIDYTVSLLYGASGDLTTQGNFTIKNATNGAERGFNNTALRISYNVNQESTIHKTKSTISSTTLSGMSLAAVGIIILAAVGIIGLVFTMMR